jgi:tubulin-folding cofactor B
MRFFILFFLSKQISDLAFVRFIGTTLFAEGIWVGIEFLSRALGKNDGSVNGHTYFQCKPNYGLFIRPNRITLTKK